MLPSARLAAVHSILVRELQMAVIAWPVKQAYVRRKDTSRSITSLTLRRCSLACRRTLTGSPYREKPLRSFRSKPLQGERRTFALRAAQIGEPLLGAALANLCSLVLLPGCLQVLLASALRSKTKSRVPAHFWLWKPPSLHFTTKAFASESFYNAAHSYDMF